MQKIFSDCKLDGIGVPVFRMVGNNLSVEFEAPNDRLAGAGSPREKDAVSGMERTDSSRKRTDSIEEHDDSDAERADSSETSRNDNGGFNATTLQNIDELRRSLSDAD